MTLSVRAVVVCAAFAAVAVFGTVHVMATDVPSPAQVPRTEGEDLYHRGYYPEAIAWWEEQASKGDAGAARHLGVEYMDGKIDVVHQDYEKSRRYHLQAAQAGDAYSMMDLGTIFEHGLGVASDLMEAARWYGWSAKYGYGPGQYNFATMLETGDGGVKDEVEAYKFYLLASAQGVGGVPFDLKTNRISADGESPIQQLKRRLTPAQLKDASARAKAFKALSGPLPN